MRELRLVVTAPDFPAALSFYRDVLGLRQVAAFPSDGGQVVLLAAGRATIELADEGHSAYIDDLEVGQRVAGPIRVAFEVADPAATTEALRAAGATVVADPVRTPWGSLNARLDGPAGVHLTLFSPEEQPLPPVPLDGPVVLAEPDPGWPVTAPDLVARIREALGGRALLVAHVGSTSVAGLIAKPVIDLLLTVADPTDELAYVPALAASGYELRIREPEWHEHRLLKRSEPAVNLHVFGDGDEEVERMLAFRDHLREEARDRQLYAATKVELASRTWEQVQDYADAKSEVVADIMSRAARRTPSMAGVFVLVSGPPASGKTTVATGLAPLLGLPLLAKDTLKEALLDGLDIQEVAASRTLGRVASDGLLALARQNSGAVLDGPWHRSRADVLAALPGRILEVFCRVDPAAARHRYAARAAGRHPGHFDLDRTDEELWGKQVAEPVAAGWPVIEVDTTGPVDLGLLVRRVRQAATAAPDVPDVPAPPHRDEPLGSTSSSKT